ncbi:ABC transporter ATP-binding protein [Filimonas effusa]|uniref:ABC transporter ATP-binding protein n=1 Tax=Filimonas effusa TaxID=2508721 RepID=A0A4Q1D2A9_9BACT|nr:ABC transporter ATP-binding protein [Filimonas effusa]RXK81195.1 ABC transporter ATP-binding protein [Filimonas effusa]
MNEPIVSVKNLSHRYSVQWAVRDISFELNKNGIYGLLGANGAGKSTIMNVMCGVIKQTQGDVFIRGVDLGRYPEKAKRYIGFLPQQPPLQNDLTVEEFLTHAANLRLMDSSKVKNAVTEVMGKCAISHFRKRLIRNLSGGYQQRVGIAQAIIHKPDFVVLDEPTNGLDPNQILEVRGLIREIAEERTVVLSTHILQEVQALCDHIWMINEGSMIFSGSMEEFDNYIVPNTLTVSLVASPSAEELMKIPGVVGVEELGGIRYRIRFTDAQEAIERIVETSVHKNWRLVEIAVEKNSLETVFAELSRKKSK